MSKKERWYKLYTEYESDDGVMKFEHVFYAQDDEDAKNKIPFGEFGTFAEHWRTWESQLMNDRGKIVDTGW